MSKVKSKCRIIIEAKRKVDLPGSCSWLNQYFPSDNGWRRWRGYESRKGAEQALPGLEYRYSLYDFRIRELGANE